MPNPYMDRLNVNFVRDALGTAEARLYITLAGLVKKVQFTLVSDGMHQPIIIINLYYLFPNLGSFTAL